MYLQNPAYATLIVHLEQAERYLKTVASFATELGRDKMLTHECTLADVTLGNVQGMLARVKQKARNG